MYTFLKFFISKTKSFDFLGQEIKFSINKEPIFKSVFGGLLSLCLYCLYVVMFYFFGKNLIFKRNPNHYYESKIIEYQTINFTNNNLLFMVRIENEEEETLDYSEYLYPVLTYWEMKYDRKTKIREKVYYDVKLTNCRNKNFSEEIIAKDFLDDFNKGMFLCPDITDLAKKNKGFIKGNWETQYMSFYSFSFDFCITEFDETSNQNNLTNCKNHTKFINQVIKNRPLYATVIFKEVYFEPENYKKPFNSKIKIFYNLLSQKLRKHDEYFFSNLNITDDEGKIFGSDEEKVEDYSYNRLEKEVEYYNPKENLTFAENSYYSFNIVADSNYRYYKRRYLKIQEIIAEVTGSMSLIIFIVQSIYAWYAKFRIDLLLFNRLVTIPDYLMINKSNFNSKSGSIINDVDNNNKRSRIERSLTNNTFRMNYRENNINDLVNQIDSEKDIQKQMYITKQKKERIIKLNSQKKNFLKKNENGIEQEMGLNNFSNYKIKTNNIKEMKQKFLKNEIPVEVTKDNIIIINNDQIKNKNIEILDKNSGNVLNDKLTEKTENIKKASIEINKEPQRNDLKITNKTDITNNGELVLNSNIDINESTNNNEKNKSFDEVNFEQTKEEFAQSIYDSYKNKKNPVQLKFYDNICIFFKCNIKKSFYFKLKEKVSERFFAKFDIFYYFKKIRNINLIKKLIFTINQVKLVDFVSNKYYTIDTLKSLGNEDYFLTEEDFLKCYENLDETNYVDNKILMEINNGM